MKDFSGHSAFSRRFERRLLRWAAYSINGGRWIRATSNFIIYSYEAFLLCDSDFRTAMHIGAWILETCVRMKTRKLTWHPVAAKTIIVFWKYYFRCPSDLSHSKIIAQKRNGTTEPFRVARTYTISDRISNCFNFHTFFRTHLIRLYTIRKMNERDGNRI